MRFLQDENVPLCVADWLTSNGHNVLKASDSSPGSSDLHWLQHAKSEARLIITSDKDFGDLVFREGKQSFGIILLRLQNLNFTERLQRLEETWSVVESNPNNCLIVISPNRIRVRKFLA
jgi:predicted nuclease of predicted toxin-antitoxin system